VIVGGRDTCVSPRASAAFAARAGCELCTLADYGHVGGPEGSNFLKHSLMTKAARAARAHLLPPEDCRL
jgi:hypothetical protein